MRLYAKIPFRLRYAPIATIAFECCFLQVLSLRRPDGFEIRRQKMFDLFILRICNPLLFCLLTGLQIPGFNKLNIFFTADFKSAGTPSGGYPGYTNKGRQYFGDLFLVSFVFSLFSEFLFEPLVECHVGTDFLLVLRLGKGQYIAR